MIDKTRHSVIPELDTRGLRKFALSTGVTIATLFGLFLPWLFRFSFPLWPWLVFAVLAAASLLSPGILKPVYYWWMRLALLISKVTTPLILGVVFFLVFIPFGLVAKLFGKDPMNRKLDPASNTYREDSKQSSRENLENPY